MVKTDVSVSMRSGKDSLLFHGDDDDDDFSRYAYSLQASEGGRMVMGKTHDNLTPSVLLGAGRDIDEDTMMTMDDFSKYAFSLPAPDSVRGRLVGNLSITHTHQKSTKVQLDPSLLPDSIQVQTTDTTCQEEDLTEFSHDVIVVQQDGATKTFKPVTATHVGARSLAVGTIAEDSNEVVVDESNGNSEIESIQMEDIDREDIYIVPANKPATTNTLAKQPHKQSLRKSVKKWTSMLWCNSSSNRSTETEDANSVWC